MASLLGGEAIAETHVPELPQVVRVHYQTMEQLQQLRALRGFQGLDWRAQYVVFELRQAGVERLQNAGWPVQVDPLRQAEQDRWLELDHQRSLRGNPDTIPGFSCYRTVEKTHADLAALAAQYPNLTKWQVIGQSWQQQQGNPNGDAIRVLVIANQDSPHPQAPLVVMAAMHARELTTAETATRLAEHILDNQSDPDIGWLLDHREIHIIAQHNPDGRRQVEAGVALWRKNQNTTACASGNLITSWPGIDLNRNSSFLWSNPNSSGNPCSDTYRGPVAASEPETQAIQNYLQQVFEAQRPAPDMTSPAPDDSEGVFISIHSFSELILFPWEGLGGGSNNNAPNHDALAILGRKFGFYTDYAVGRTLLGPAGGTTPDYAYGEFGVAAYTFELGTQFQQDCDSFEQTIWPDNRDALMFAARAARRPYQTPAGPEITAFDANVVGNQIQFTGQAADNRYFRGFSTELPTDDPIADVVEITVSLGVPPYLANQTYVFPVANPAVQTPFSGNLPTGTLPPENGLIFVVASDADGATGVPRVIAV
ncbi:MAG: M14 family zinc carboxypeptidase, partial [Pseudomonadota bacterium]